MKVKLTLSINPTLPTGNLSEFNRLDFIAPLVVMANEHSSSDPLIDSINGNTSLF